MRSFTEVIEAFGGVVPFRDAMDLPDVNARQMKQRDSIPSRYWPQVVAAASERGIRGVNYETLAKLSAAKNPIPKRSKTAGVQ
jgi:hypothetical protein